MVFNFFILLILSSIVKSALLPLELTALCSLTTTLTGFPPAWNCANLNLTSQCTWPGVTCNAAGDRVSGMYENLTNNRD